MNHIDFYQECLKGKEQQEALHWMGLYVEKPVVWSVKEIEQILKEVKKEAKLTSMRPLYRLFNGRDTGLPLASMLSLKGRDGTRKHLYNLSVVMSERE